MSRLTLRGTASSSRASTTLCETTGAKGDLGNIDFVWVMFKSAILTSRAIPSGRVQRVSFLRGRFFVLNTNRVSVRSFSNAQQRRVYHSRQRSSVTFTLLPEPKSRARKSIRLIPKKREGIFSNSLPCLPSLPVSLTTGTRHSGLDFVVVTRNDGHIKTSLATTSW